MKEEKKKKRRRRRRRNNEVGFDFHPARSNSLKKGFVNIH